LLALFFTQFLTLFQVAPLTIHNICKVVDRGMVTKEVKLLEIIGWHFRMFAHGSTKLKGRKSNEYENLDLNHPEQLTLAILKTLPKQ
jgi:hypothetical protein